MRQSPCRQVWHLVAGRSLHESDAAVEMRCLPLRWRGETMTGNVFDHVLHFAEDCIATWMRRIGAAESASDFGQEDRRATADPHSGQFINHVSSALAQRGDDAERLPAKPTDAAAGITDGRASVAR